MRVLRVRHETIYEYDSPVSFGVHRLRVRPRDGHDIRLKSSTLHIDPVPTITWQRDVLGNSVASLEFPETESTSLTIVSDVTVEHYGEGIDVVTAIESYASASPFQYAPLDRAELLPYSGLLFARYDSRFFNWIQSVSRVPGDTVAAISGINERIAADFEYIRRDAQGVQHPSATIASGAGSCRDFATLFIEACRYLGIAARFVSGYVYSPDSPGVSGTTHAWAEVYLPGAGWCGFDPTLGCSVQSDHVAVAVARHPEAVPPVEGEFRGSPDGSQLTVNVRVT